MTRSLHRLLLSPSGRISRSTFFWTALAVSISFLVLFVFLESIFSREATWVLYPLFFWALYALSVKRLHDRGQSAWWLLLIALPVLGPVWLAFTLLLRKGTPGENQYGGDPREYGADYLSVDIGKPGGVK